MRHPAIEFYHSQRHAWPSLKGQTWRFEGQIWERGPIWARRSSEDGWRLVAAPDRVTIIDPQGQVRTWPEDER